MAWYTVYELSGNNRRLAAVLLVVVAFAVHRLVYKPMRKRLFGGV